MIAYGALETRPRSFGCGEFFNSGGWKGDFNIKGQGQTNCDLNYTLIYNLMIIVMLVFVGLAAIRLY